MGLGVWPLKEFLVSRSTDQTQEGCSGKTDSKAELVRGMGAGASEWYLRSLRERWPSLIPDGPGAE